MTAIASPGAIPVPWRRMPWVTWRLHRFSLLGILGVFAVAAAGYAVSGVTVPRSSGQPEWGTGGAASVDILSTGIQAGLLLPVLAGMFLGAPLLAREAERKTVALAWTQGASRTRWLLGQVIPIAVVLAVAAAAISAEFNWWIGPDAATGRGWLTPARFTMHSLPLAGWTVMALALGVFAGAVIRRTIPAMLATFGCYLTLFYLTSLSWRPSYLPPLHRTWPVTFSANGANGGYSFGYGLNSLGGRPGPDVLSQELTWPNGRPLPPYSVHPGSWYRLHHIQMWLTYQPATRYGLFRYIEFGWLIALSVVLVAATALIIRRRSA